MKRAVVVLALLSAPVLATALRDFAGMRGDANMGWNTANGSPSGPSAPSPTFDLIAGQTTPNDLSDSLTVNSVAMTLVLACDAQGIGGTTWTCRDASGSVTLSETATGASPISTILTPFHAIDSAERGVSYASAGKMHRASSSSVADIGTQDFYIETVIRQTTAGSAGTYFSKRGAGAGFSIQRSTTNFYTVTVSDSIDTLSTGGISLSSGAYAHLAIVADRNGGASGLRVYTNGTSVATGNIDLVDSLSAADSFTIGGTATAAGASSGADPLVSIRIFVCPTSNQNCFASSSIDSVVRERAARAFGVLPTIAAGTAAPTTLTRATTAHVDVVDGNVRHLYLVGSNAPRVARRTHSGGTVVAGYLSEPSVSNIALQSQTLGTTWTAITAGDNVLADAFAGADLSVTGDDIDGNNSSGEHGLRQGITVTAATHSFSVWAKAGAQSFVALRNATIANGAAWFDVSTCTSGSCTVGEDCAAAVGTVQAGVIQARAQRYPIDTTGDGVADVNLCRVGISYTGTAASHNHDLLCAPSNGNLTYTDGDTTADCGFWGARVEAFPTMTSYIATTTAAVARNGDDVRFDGASHYTGSPSTMDVAVLCPNFDAIASGFWVAGVSATDFAALRSSAADFFDAGGENAGTQWQIVGSSDVFNGVAHSMRQTMETNNIVAYYDGISIGTDNLANLPTVAGAVLRLGQGAGGGGNPACLISRARLWSSLVAP